MEDTRPKTDIKELNERIRRIVERENELRIEIDKNSCGIRGGRIMNNELLTAGNLYGSLINDIGNILCRGTWQKYVGKSIL